MHAASGTLGAGASGSVRLALMRIIFKSVGLPELYPVAKFVMWIKHEGIYDAVRGHVESNGFDWNEELDNFYVAEGLHKALVATKPQLFSSPAICLETLNNLYPYISDISSDDMLKAIRQALSHKGKFPLTLIILDEVQQFIGESSERSISVQEMVEAITKSIGGKLMFIGTGQTAVTGTANLARLQGRFTIRVELSDSDVDAVIRQVILAKKPEAKEPISELMTKNLGEISRHLQGTTIGHVQADVQNFTQDYPVLPVHRRFWENALRVLDQTGTDSQLRNQLSMIHKVIQTNANEQLGHVIGADYLYFDSADKLLQARILPRKVHEKTMTWLRGTDDDKLTARATGLIFLVNKLAGSNTEIGIKATIDTLADLLVEDLSRGSSNLRNKLPGLLDKCELLMKVGDEYRIQTEESTAWNDEFRSQQSLLANVADRIEAERDDRIRKRMGELTRKIALTQGQSKVSREVSTVFDSKLPDDRDKRVYIWVRDGWGIDENSVRAEAREAGNTSPTIFVFIPKRSADDLRHQLIDYKASFATIEKRGTPNTPEGKEAHAAMETTKRNADNRISDLLNDAFSGARVFQCGGTEISGNDLFASIMEAADKSLTRLYPQFETADNGGWGKVFDKASKGGPDSLKAVGYEGEVAQNSVCKAVLSFIASGKSGTEIRSHFESAPYGWSRDAVDGGLMALLVAGLIRAQEDRGQVINFKDLARSAIGKTSFKVESANVTAPQRIKLRKLFQKIGINANPNQEHTVARDFIDKLLELAQKAGGEEPRPPKPDVSILNEIRLTLGNEQLLAIYNNQDWISNAIDTWIALADQIAKRLPVWNTLNRQLKHAEDLDGVDVLKSQVEHISAKHQLLDDPDPMPTLIASLTQILRDQLNEIKADWDNSWNEGEALLNVDENWEKLEAEQRHDLRKPRGLVQASLPIIEVQSTETILTTLDCNSLSNLKDRIAALPGRYNTMLLEAARLLEPKAQEVQLPRRTVKTAEEIEGWINEARNILLDKIKNGPVVL